jgi:hypothetical protein
VEQTLLEHGFTLVSRRDDERQFVRDHVFGLATARKCSDGQL